MGFFSNPLKATKGFVNKFVPFGRHLTGANADRQKRFYHEAVSRYNAYASEAQGNIDNMSNSLQQSIQNMQALEQQKYIAQLKGEQLSGQISQYESNLSDLERRKSKTAAESTNLQSVFESFKSKLPAMEQRISEVQGLPQNFQTLFENITAQKEKLKGLTSEEAEGEIRKYKQDVENLRKNREETENKIRSAMAEITGQHQGLESEKAGLEDKLTSYKYRQEQLLQEGSKFADHKNRLQQLIQDYRQEQQDITSKYSQHQTNIQTQEKQLQDYIASSQQQLDSLGSDVNYRMGKYKRDSRDAGIAQGLGIAALTFGAGAGLGALAGKATAGSMTSSILGSLGSGLKGAALFGGLAHYLNKANAGSKLSGVEPMNLSSLAADPYSAKAANFDLGTVKQSIPELGGLKQALAHFNMPSVPKLKDLPQLHEALGKIASYKDIEGLSLGLPSMTSASGKKYSSAVLYDSNFLKKLTKMSYRLGLPYLKTKENINYA